MADIHRVIARVLLVLVACLVWIAPAHASGSYPATSGSSQGYYCDPGSTTSCAEFRYNSSRSWNPSRLAECEYGKSLNGWYSVALRDPGYGWNAQCNYQSSAGGGTFIYTLESRVVPLPGAACVGAPAGSTNGTLTSGSCSCPAGTSVNATNNGCVNLQNAYCSQASGQAGGDRVVQTSGAAASGTATVCIDGLGPLSDGSTASCAATGSSLMSAQKDGKWYTWYSTTYTGSPCAGSEASSAAVPPDDKPAECTDAATCPPPVGKCPGTVNGVAVWVECGKTSVVDTKKTTQNGTNVDGSAGSRTTTQTDSTTCTGASCSTTTTTQECKPDGTDCKATGTVVTSSSKGTYCAAKPGDPQCGDQAGWGGSCSAGFQCSGDAALCAAAKGVWEQKCALVDGPATPNAAQTAYAAAVAASGTGITSTSTAISSSSFDQANALGVSAACITDKVITVMDRQLTIPFSLVCPYVGYLGTLNLALSFLVAAFIVFRRTA